MKRRTFYVVAIILVCIGAVSGLALTQIRSKSLLDICTGDECTKTIKEYTPLEAVENDELSAEARSDEELLVDAEASDEVASEVKVETVDTLTILADSSPSTDEKVYNRNVFIAGESVTLNQLDVDGIAFAAGNKVKSHGRQNYLVAAGQDLSVDSVTAKDAFLAGKEIDFSKSAKIRDGFLAAEKVTIRGNVTGSLYIAAAQVIFDNATVDSDVKLVAGNLEFKGDSKIYGTLLYNSDIKTINLEKDKIAGIKTYESPSINSENSVAITALKMVRSFCVTTVSIAFLALLLSKISNKHYENLLKTNNGIKDLCLGLVSIIVVPAILFIVLFIEYFSIIGFLGILMLVASFIIGTGIAAVRFGKAVETSLFKNKNTSIYSICLIGAISIAIIGLIPVLGGSIIALGVISGFGYVIGETIHNILPAIKAKTGK